MATESKKEKKPRVKKAPELKLHPIIVCLSQASLDKVKAAMSKDKKLTRSKLLRSIIEENL